MKKLIAMLLLVTLLLTACQQPANPSVSDQSNSSSDSNISSSNPSSSGSLSSNSSSSLSSSSEPSIPSLSSDANGEILFFGQPLDEVDFNQYIDKNYYFDTSTPEGAYLNNIIQWLTLPTLSLPYPESCLNHPVSKASLIRHIYSIYRDGFNGKTLDDFEVVQTEEYGMIMGDPHIIPLEDAVAALSAYFGNIDAEEVIKSSKMYNEKVNGVIDTCGTGGGYPPVFIGNVKLINDNTLLIPVYDVPSDEYEINFGDLNAYLNTLSQYKEYQLTIKLYDDHWQYLKGELVKEVKK